MNVIAHVTRPDGSVGTVNLGDRDDVIECRVDILTDYATLAAGGPITYQQHLDVVAAAMRDVIAHGWPVHEGGWPL